MRLFFGAPEAEVLFFPSVGTPMMEAIAHAFLHPAAHILNLNTGFFGWGWGKIARIYGAQVHEYKPETGRTYDPQRLTELLAEHRPRILLMQASDTSTGVRNNTKLGEIISNDSPFTFIAVDAILEAGISPIKMDEEGIDVLVGAGQKAFMLPPGLGFILINRRAAEFLLGTKKSYPGLYFDLRLEISAQRNYSPRFTMPTAHMAALAYVTDKIFANEQEWYQSFVRRASRARDVLSRLGFSLFTKESPSNGISVLFPPGEITASAVMKIAEEKGYVIAGGIDELSGKVIRLAHFPGVADEDLERFFQILEQYFKSA